MNSIKRWPDYTAKSAHSDHLLDAAKKRWPDCTVQFYGLELAIGFTVSHGWVQRGDQVSMGCMCHYREMSAIPGNFGTPGYRLIFVHTLFHVKNP